MKLAVICDRAKSTHEEVHTVIAILARCSHTLRVGRYFTISIASLGEFARFMTGLRLGSGLR